MSESDLIWMSLLIFMPSAFALVLLFFPRGTEEYMRWWTLLGTAVTFVVSAIVFINGQVADRDPEEDHEFAYWNREVDLNKALQEAAQETVAFLRDQRGMSAADAYALASAGVDFRIAEAVDSVQMVYGAIPKRIFKQTPEYWSKR